MNIAANMNRFLIYIAIILSIGTMSCESSVTDANPNGDGQSFSCGVFSYSDSVFFINASAENKIRPLQNLNGKFRAFPEGLMLDSISGEIDINRSETGLKYKISFSPASSPLTVCEFELLIAGINYLDKVYLLNQNDFLAPPIFNANPSGLSPCDDDDDDDDDDDCKFDEVGPGNTKLADLGIAIDSSTGIIDLKKTVENKAFGETPVNGSTIEGKMYYRLQDNSLGALNGIDLKIFYFNTLKDVPQSLLDEIEQKKTGVLGAKFFYNPINARISADNPRTKPRPPYLIIVASLE